MAEMALRFVMVTDGTDFIIHGSAKQTPAEMFKALIPLWDFDPAIDKSYFFEATLELPKKIDAPITG
jgi:hypothetical protein